MAQFNPYAPQNPYGPPQGSFPPPQQSPYGGGFPPQMPPDAFGPGMGAPVGPGGGLRPYESGGFADDSNGDLSGSGGGGGLFTLKNAFYTALAGLVAVASYKFFTRNKEEGDGSHGSTESPAQKANTALSASFKKLKTASDKATLYPQIIANLKKLNQAVPKAPSDSDDPVSSAQRQALANLNAAYGFDPEAADSYDADDQLGSLTSTQVGDIETAHTEFAKAFAPEEAEDDEHDGNEE